ncbi:DUF1304 domain-containing protein [Lactococcus petauri]|uniref:DUF1304 domain-containing protein n=1 Tax=Lactococcus petauri TaxID=1940789 RepID=UPI003852C7B5
MISLIILIVVAIEHLFFGYIEMFGSREIKSKAFGFEEKELNNPLLQTALANQGIYNVGFGLLILLFLSLQVTPIVLIGMMSFVILVGAYGAYTVDKKIFLLQVVPAILGIFSLTMS